MCATVQDTTLEDCRLVLPITKIDHVSFATHSIDESLRWFSALFGARELHRHRVESEGYTFCELEIPNGQVMFELIEPIGEHSFVARFLRAHGPGFHHITLQVEDVDEAAALLREHEIEPWGGVRGSGHYKQTFIHPRDSNGILIQFFQAHQDGDGQHREEGVGQPTVTPAGSTSRPVRRRSSR